MKEEKIMILTMLEQGKITSEEAIKLLEALEDQSSRGEDRSSDFKNERKEKYNFKETLNETLNNLEDIGSDIGSVLSGMFDGLLDIGSSFPFKYNYETTTSSLNMDLAGIENPSLDLRAINGEIILRPNKGENLSINVMCQYKKGLLIGNEPYFDFNRLDQKIIFSPSYNKDISIKLDVFVPEKNYDEIKLNTSNGKIYLHELNARSLKSVTSNSPIEIVGGSMDLMDLTTKNGKVEMRDTHSSLIKAYTTNSSVILNNIKAKTIDASTCNSKIILNNIQSDSIVCKASNSSIDANSIDARDISLTTSNGRLFLCGINTSSAKDISLVTSNNSIVAEIRPGDRGAIFDLETSMGNLDLDIKDLIYGVNKQVNLGLKKIVAHNENYHPDRDHLKLLASTSNGSIKVN